jgi:hypothetical protein
MSNPVVIYRSDLLFAKRLDYEAQKMVRFIFVLPCGVPCFAAQLTSPFFPFLKGAERIACNFSFLPDHLLVKCNNVVCPYCSNHNAFLGNQG